MAEEKVAKLPKPQWEVNLLRFLAILFLPIAATIALATLVSLIGDWGFKSGLIYMRGEATFFSLGPFFVAVIIAIIAKWTVSKKAALWVFWIAVVGVLTFVGAAAIPETINTKPIVSAASTFKELPGLTREVGTNGEKFSPAPSGFVPCIDFMGEGCPDIMRTWDAAPDRELTVADLQKVLDDSGWKDVKISHSRYCDMSDKGRDPYCEAEGMVGQYKATVSIVKVSDHWELRMYLRLPTNAR